MPFAFLKIFEDGAAVRIMVKTFCRLQPSCARGNTMQIAISNIRGYRLCAHHLAQKLPRTHTAEAAGACGLQNSPPGVWETALMNRLEGCTLQELRHALYCDKTLLQAWSFRGAPVVFPTGESDAFLTPLITRPGEEPWIYTRGIAAALDFLQIPFDTLLSLVKDAAGYLRDHTVKSKELLDRTLAGLVESALPPGKQALWSAPSMYANGQTVGEAAVSFLLRPCSFASLVVFGERRGASPTFTSFQRWTGCEPHRLPDAEKVLARKFLHCYGPTTVRSFMEWLGWSPQQAKRIWSSIADEMEPVQAGGKTCDMLSADLESLMAAEPEEDCFILMGAHDPYLDLKDRGVILEDTSLRRLVWRTVANPGVLLRGGRIAGIWRPKMRKECLDITITPFERLGSAGHRVVERLAEEYAAFRMLRLCKIEITEGITP